MTAIRKLHWEREIAAQGIEIRHDMFGYYMCTLTEAEHEDEGNPSVGFDGRTHWSTIAGAVNAFRRGDRPC